MQFEKLSAFDEYISLAQLLKLDNYSAHYFQTPCVKTFLKASFISVHRDRMFKISKSPPSEAMTDEQLLAAWQRSGSVRYLGLLFERYLPMVYGVCIKILRDKGKAEDAVMGIYESMAEKIQTHEVTAFRGWLYVLARNYCLMEWRRLQRHPVEYHAPDTLQHFDSGEEMPEPDFPAPAPAYALQQCLQQLATLQRRCVQLFYYDNLSYKEIADLVKEEVGKVRSSIQNGKRNLKICMEQGT